MLSSRVAIAGIIAIVGGHDAWGADLPRKAPAIAPAAPIALSWTGFYVGVHAGYSWGRWDGDLTFDPGTGPIVVFDPSHRKIDANGWLAGGRSGSTISSTPLYLGSKPMRRGQTSKAAEASTQFPAT
jgi:hypothetical protein